MSDVTEETRIEGDMCILAGGFFTIDALYKDTAAV